MKKYLVPIIIVIILAGGAYVLFGQPSWLKPVPQKYTGPVEKITVSNIEEYSTLVWVAEHQGYFTDNGLEVTTKDYQSGKAAADALLAGEADISVSADIVFVSNVFTNPDLRTLGTVATVENVGLVARKDRGVIKPSDLKGKKIGATSKSVSEFFLGTFLTFNGLSLADVEVVDLKPKDMGDALLRGDVDAVSTWEPNVFNIKQQLGNRAISWSAQNGQKYNMLLLTKEKFLRDHTGAIERFVKSIVQAEEFVRDNNETAKNFIAEKYHYSPLYIDSAWPQYEFVVKLSQSLLLTMEDEARWRIKNKLTDITTVPNYLNFIYFDALEKVRPEAVTIAH